MAVFRKFVANTIAQVASTFQNLQWGLQYLDGNNMFLPWATWVPTFTPSGSMTYANVSITHARYLKFERLVFFSTLFTGTTGGTASTTIQMTLPSKVFVDSAYPCGIVDTTSVTGRATSAAGTNIVDILRYDGASYGLGSGRAFVLSGFYEEKLDGGN